MLPIRKYQVMREKTNSLHKWENSLEKVSLEKVENIFLHNTKIPENFDIKHLRWSKIYLSKETKNAPKKRYSSNFRSSCMEVFCKKGTSPNGCCRNFVVETYWCKETEVIIKFQWQPREVFYEKAAIKNFDTCLFAYH